MRIAIHQPNYLPYIGYFQKMSMVDIFVLLDNVQFSKDSYTQRTRIKTKDGPSWLTIPLEKKSHFRLIKDIELPSSPVWKKKHNRSLIANYSRSPFFDRSFVNDYYTKRIAGLSEFNEYGIQYIRRAFGINSKIIRASDLDINPELTSTDLLIKILNLLGATAYVSGVGGSKYQDPTLFEANEIQLIYHKFSPFEYMQRWEDFLPYTSALDLLFSVGSEKCKALFSDDNLWQAGLDGRESSGHDGIHNSGEISS